jgi:hypothetical protein
LAIWGDSFAPANLSTAQIATPLDLEGPVISEPGGANLAMLAGLFEDDLTVVASGGLSADSSLFAAAYLYLPHDAIVPAPVQVADAVPPLLAKQGIPLRIVNRVDAQNRPVGERTAPLEIARWVLKQLGR